MNVTLSKSTVPDTAPVVAVARVIVKFGDVPEIPMTLSLAGMFVPTATWPTEMVPLTAEAVKVVAAPALLLVAVAGELAAHAVTLTEGAFLIGASVQVSPLIPLTMTKPVVPSGVKQAVTVSPTPIVNPSAISQVADWLQLLASPVNLCP